MAIMIGNLGVNGIEERRSRGETVRGRGGHWKDDDYTRLSNLLADTPIMALCRRHHLDIDVHVFSSVMMRYSMRWGGR